jgi:MtN3 and saliva related transmembrane protein
MNMIELLGYFAAVCTTISFLPQAIQIVRTKDTTSISLMMYTIFTIGVFLWFVFGLYKNSMPIILANGTTLLFAITILYFKIKYK